MDYTVCCHWNVNFNVYLMDKRHCEICGCETDYTPVCNDLECQAKYLSKHKDMAWDNLLKKIQKDGNLGV